MAGGVSGAVSDSSCSRRSGAFPAPCLPGTVPRVPRSCVRGFLSAMPGGRTALMLQRQRNAGHACAAHGGHHDSRPIGRHAQRFSHRSSLRRPQPSRHQRSENHVDPSSHCSRLAGPGAGQSFPGCTRHPLSAEGGQLRLHAGIFEGTGLGHHRGPGRYRDAVCPGPGQQGGGHVVVVQPGPAEVQGHQCQGAAPGRQRPELRDGGGKAPGAGGVPVRVADRQGRRGGHARAVS